MKCPQCDGRCHQGRHWERKDGTFGEWYTCQECGWHFFPGEYVKPRLGRVCPLCGAAAVVLSVKHYSGARRRILRCKTCLAVFYEEC